MSWSWIVIGMYTQFGLGFVKCWLLFVSNRGVTKSRENFFSGKLVSFRLKVLVFKLLQYFYILGGFVWLHHWRNSYWAPQLCCALKCDLNYLEQKASDVTLVFFRLKRVATQLSTSLRLMSFVRGVDFFQLKVVVSWLVLHHRFLGS